MPHRRLITNERSTRRRAVSLVAALLLVAAAGCGGPSGPTSDPDACGSFVVPNRMGLAWDVLNHRISKWNLALNGAAEGSCEATELDATFVGGDFSTGETLTDTPIVRYGYQRVDGATESDRLGAARLTLPVTLEGPEGVFGDTLVVSRDEVSLRNFPEVVAIIEGISFDTDVDQPEAYPEDYNPAHGYTSRGIGASVEVTSLDEEQIELTYRLRFGFGASHDRLALNRAIEHARVDGELRVLLVGVDNTDSVRRGGVEYTMEYPNPRPFQDQEIEHAPPEKTGVELQGRAEGPRGLWGVQSFDFVLDPSLSCARDSDCSEGESCTDAGVCTTEIALPGYYVRELTVDVEQTLYDPRTGAANFLLDGYASTATSAITFHALRSNFTGRMVWIQGGSASEPSRFESEFETGQKTFSLDD